MKSLQELIADTSDSINEGMPHQVLSRKNKPKLFEYIRNRFNDDDYFFDELCQALIENNILETVVYDMAEKNHITIKKNF